VWVLDLLGLPRGGAVGFVTGGTMANCTCLAAARDAVLARAGWDIAADGLVGSSGVRVLVGAERHDSVDLVLRYLGVGAPELVSVDAQGRIDPAALRETLENGDDRPVVVVLQAGNIDSGAFDPFEATIAVAHEYGAWVHVDGAFGLFAGATPRYRHLVHGYQAADSWAPTPTRRSMCPPTAGWRSCAIRPLCGRRCRCTVTTSSTTPPAIRSRRSPRLSRRARAFTVWEVLRSLGRSGVAEFVERLAGHAQAFADGIAGIEGADVLNDVVFTRVCAAFGDDVRTLDVVRRMMANGTAWTSGSVWREQAMLRISVSNWSTTDDDVERTLDALRTAVAAS
jgi:glutamate/tyrosine decarboxylase-like PLP-dependent enzyme